MSGLYSSVVEAIGNTPLVELGRLTQHLDLDGRILAKLDNLLPGYSKKDRAARHIIEAARADGRLQPGQPVVELTSGNMGTGLAIVCGVFGHPFTAVMSAGNSTERAQMMRGLGAQVVIVPQATGGIEGRVTAADLAAVDAQVQAIVREAGAFRADQFEDAGNPASHETGTGPEIWTQSGGSVTAFCDFAGSGGTLAGAARFLGKHGVRSYAVEPETAQAIAGLKVTCADHPVQGGGYAMDNLSHLKGLDLAGTVPVSGDDARKYARLLAQTEGIFGGFSAGANLAGAVALLRGAEKGGTIAFVVCDSGLKYLSTGLWEDRA